MLRGITSIVCSLALSAAVAAETFRADWSRVKPYASAVDKTKSGSKADFVAVVTNDCLVIAVRSLDNALVKARVDIPASRIAYAGRYMTVRTVLSGAGCDSCGGLLQGQIDRSDQGLAKKHYWKPATLPIMSEPAVWTKTRLLDPKLGELSFTYELKKPGVYRFHAFELAEAPDPMSDYTIGRNYLVNGGAEQGHYATSAVGERSVRFGTKGGVIEPMKGKLFAGMLKPSVTSSVVHSGSRAFELAHKADEDGKFFFNPVPVVDDRAFVFSFWVKAARRCRFRAGLFVASGAAYERQLTATEEWSKVSLRIPRWGHEGMDGLRFYGTVTGFGQAVPFVEPMDEACLWLDDAFSSVGTLKGEYESEPLALEVIRDFDRPEHRRGIYRPGECVVEWVKVHATPSAKGPYTLELVLRDWRNREMISSRRKYVLKDSESLRIELPLPKGLRGPLTLSWMVIDAKRHASSVTQYLGVQPDCERLEPRLSVNVMFGSPEQSLSFMREFGIGGARVWGPCRNWDLDCGYAYTKLFHDAGIRTLFVLGVPHLVHDGKTLRGEALLPADPTDWFSRQAKLLDEHRGEVDIYEFLNEYNIWNGRLRSPDPERFSEPTLEKYLETIAAFRPLLRKHDPTALLAGCATCSTDLAFIGKFLEKGGGEHVDMITEHAYTGNPDCPDYAQTLAIGLAQARAAGVLKWAQSEAGATSPNHLTPGLIHPQALEQLSNDLRNMLIAWARGLAFYSHFQLVTGRMGTDWNLTYLGNGENGFEDIPKPALFAFRTAADQLADAACLAEAKLPGGYKAYVFERGAVRVAVIWKWNGGSARLKPVSALAESVWRDAMGNLLSGKEVEISTYPVYCESTLSADEVARSLEASERTVLEETSEACDASDSNLLLLNHP